MDDCVLFCIAQKKWPKSIQLSYEDLSKINEAHRFRLDKVELKNPNKNIALVYLSIIYTWKSIKNVYNNYYESELLDGSYFVADIQDYFEYFINNTKLSLLILL